MYHSQASAPPPGAATVRLRPQGATTTTSGGGAQPQPPASHTTANPTPPSAAGVAGSGGAMFSDYMNRPPPGRCPSPHPHPHPHPHPFHPHLQYRTLFPPPWMSLNIPPPKTLFFLNMFRLNMAYDTTWGYIPKLHMNNTTRCFWVGWAVLPTVTELTDLVRRRYPFIRGQVRHIVTLEPVVRRCVLESRWFSVGMVLGGECGGDLGGRRVAAADESVCGSLSTL
jgi:hypothetical protein